MKSKTFWVCIIFWILITLLRLFNHQPWFDEANVWIIAQKANLFQLFLLPKIEGHPFLWYMVIMPFAKLNLAYPYSLLIVNWLFGLGTILLIWKYAPFNNWLKVFITFSFPFFVLFPIVARCYAISIFLLFILTVLFEKKSKYPIIYSVLIFLCANTNVMAMIGAFVFGGFLLFDLIKEKQVKNILLSGFVGFLTVLTLFFQYYGLDKTFTDSKLTSGINFNFWSHAFIFPQVINFIFLIIFIITFSFLLFKSKKAIIFISVCYSYLLGIFMLSYSGNEWHHYFFYVYLLISAWFLLNDSYVKNNIKQITSFVLILLSLFFVIDYRYTPHVFHSNSKNISEFIKENENARFILFSGTFLSVIPYFEKSKLYDIYHYQTGLNINEKVIKIKHDETISAEKIYNLMAKNKINYAIADKYFDYIKDEKYNLKFIPVKIYNLGFNQFYFIYRIENQ